MYYNVIHSIAKHMQQGQITIKPYAKKLKKQISRRVKDDQIVGLSERYRVDLVLEKMEEDSLELQRYIS